MRFRRILKYLLSIFFIIAGAVHFLRPNFYLKIMPPYIPFSLAMVYLSGLAEIVLGALIPVPRMTRLAAWGLILLLIAVFPANIHMALHPDYFPEIPKWGLYGRLPLQGVLILWAWWFTSDRSFAGKNRIVFGN